MKHIKSFENYKENKLLQEDFNKKILLLSDVKLDGKDEDLFKRVFEKLLANSKYEQSIKDEISNYLSETEFLKEGFFDKLKDRFPKAAEVSKKLTDKAESLLSGLLQKAKDAVSFVKKISEGIKELFISVIEKGKAFFNEQIKSGKLRSKVEELAKSKKEGLIADVKKSKEIIDFYRKKFLGKLLSSSEGNLTDFFTKEQEPVVESMINEEKGNVIATLVHKIEAVPPFSWLHKVAQAGEAGASQLVKAISDVTSKLGGPAFELPVIALLIGVVIEQIVKGQAGGWLITLAGSTTPLGIAIKGIKTMAFFIALIVSIDAVVGEKLLGGAHAGHGDEKHSTDKKEASKPEPKESEQKSERENIVGETPTEQK